MNALKPSPRITSDSMGSRTPIFSSPSKSKGLSKFTSPKKGLPSPRITTRQLEMNKAPLNKYLKPSTFNADQCKCTHVLVADDDTLQHMYYQNLFQRCMDLGQIDLKPTEFKLELCLSGEDLIEKYLKFKSCGCKKLRMVITDYFMGEKKLNGYETAQKLREIGHTGALLLRTGEDKADLALAHPDLDRIVTCVIEKSDAKGGKENIIKYMKQKDEL